MKNFLLLFLLIVINQNLLSQEKERVFYDGIIKADSLGISDVHIINKATLKGTITNSKGAFSLPLKIGDVLYISHINYVTKEFTITTKNIKSILIFIEPKTHTLDEVVLKKKRSLFYIDSQIMPNEILNATTLKLPFSSNKNLIENKSTLRAESGVAVNLVSLINTFNGKRKKEKELKKAKLRDSKLDKLKSKFPDSFFYHQLKIQKGYINQFIEYCVTNGVLDYPERENILKLTTFLIEKSKTFIHKK